MSPLPIPARWLLRFNSGFRPEHLERGNELENPKREVRFGVTLMIDETIESHAWREFLKVDQAAGSR